MGRSNPRRRTTVAAWALTLTFAASGLVLTEPARGDSTKLMDSQLSPGRAGMTAVGSGDVVFLLGGLADGLESRDILRFDTNTDELSTVGQLPVAVSRMAAAVHEQKAYLFGGQQNGSFFNHVIRYDMADGSISTRGAHLPSSRSLATAVATEDAVYLFGGLSGGGELDQILRYDLENDKVETLGAVLPEQAGKFGHSGFYFEGSIYLMGGVSQGLPSSKIVKFTPSTGQAQILSVQLPVGLAYYAFTFDGMNAYALGGKTNQNANNMSKAIYRFRPSDNTVVKMAGNLPGERQLATGYFNGSDSFAFGGVRADGSYLSEIVRYVVAPGSPQDPSALPGLEVGSILVRWSPPNDNTYSTPIVKYTVHRGLSRNVTPLVDVAPDGELRYLDRNLDLTRTYHYMITAWTQQGEGSFSLEVCSRPSPWAPLPHDMVECVQPF